MSFSEWKEVSLKEAIEFNPRETLKKGTIAKKIGMDKLGTFQRRIEGFELSSFSGGTKFRNGDTLLARITPCLENGKTAQVTLLDDDEIAFGSTEYIVLREKSGKSINDFIFYLAISPYLRDIAIKSMTGTSGRQRAQKDVIENTKIKLPPLHEQKAIAHILSTLDDKIEVNNQINKTLENMAQAIFKQWFVDFEFPNEDGEPYKSSGGEMVETELGLIPKGWKVSTVGELTAIVSKGTTPRKSDIDCATDNNCVKFLKVKDISDHGVIDLTGLEMIPSSIHLNQLKRSVLKYKDVLISIAGTIGRVSYVNEELVNANTNQAVAFIRLKDVEKHFLLMHYKFKSSDFQDSIRSKIVQGVQANISLSVIKDEKLILPDDNVLGLYNNVLNNIFNESNILYKEINSLTNIRDTLLPKLMSGEIRVPMDEEGEAS